MNEFQNFICHGREKGISNLKEYMTELSNTLIDEHSEMKSELKLEFLVNSMDKLFLNDYDSEIAAADVAISILLAAIDDLNDSDKYYNSLVNSYLKKDELEKKKLYSEFDKVLSKIIDEGMNNSSIKEDMEKYIIKEIIPLEKLKNEDDLKGNILDELNQKKEELLELEMQIKDLQAKYNEKLAEYKDQKEKLNEKSLDSIDQAIKATCFNHNYESNVAIKIIEMMIASDFGKTGEYEYISATYDDGNEKNGFVRDNIIKDASIEPLGVRIIGHILTCFDLIKDSENLPIYLKESALEIEKVAGNLKDLSIEEKVDYLNNLSKEGTYSLAKIFVETRYNFTKVRKNAGSEEEVTSKVEINPDFVIERV